MSASPPDQEQKRAEAAQALQREALKLAVEYHARIAQAPTTKGAASATSLTATARELASFLREAADNAGVTAEDFEPEGQ